MLTPFIGFWGALLVSPFLTAIFGYIIEKAADPPRLYRATTSTACC